MSNEQFQMGDFVNVHGSDGIPCGQTRINSQGYKVFGTEDGRVWTDEGKWVGASVTHSFPYIEKAQMTEESGWLIERWINSGLQYWNGMFLDSSRGFSSDNQRAVRFAREVDAPPVLSWLLDGQGKVSEHMWIGPEPIPHKSVSQQESEAKNG